MSVASLSSISSSDSKTIDSFDDMGLRDELLRGIYSYGFEKPSTIQSKAIVPTISGRDIIGSAFPRSLWTAFTKPCSPGPVWYWKDRHFLNWCLEPN